MYIDPAFGGMLLQVIVVIAAVGGAVIYSLRRKISGLFKKNKDAEENAGNQNEIKTGTAAGNNAGNVIDPLANDDK